MTSQKENICEVLEKKLHKKTSRRQFEMLVAEMEEFPDVARGIGKFGSSKVQCYEKWEDISNKLNGIEPPTRTVKEWKKVWADLKRNTKEKISNNKKELNATGGGPWNESILSPMEEAVDNILCLEIAANPSGKTFGTPNCEHNNSFKSHLPETTNSNIPHTKSKKRKIFTEDRNRFMDQQTKNQENMLSYMKMMEKNLYKMQQSVKEMVKKEDEKIQLWKTIRDNDNLRVKIALEKLELKKKKIELKELELNLRE